MIEIHIEDHPDQQFSLILEGRRVTMRLVYNQTTERWSFDLSIDDLPILNGRRIVTGIDLLAPFDLGIGVIFAAPVTPGAVPDRDQLANGLVKLFQTTQAEIETTVIPPVVDPQEPNVRPIIWQPAPPTYFGQAFIVGRLLDQIEEGFAVDFINDEVLIRSNADPSLNFIDTVAGALDAGKLEFSRASVAYRYNDEGLIEQVANDVLRVQHDPLTGVRRGVLIEPASTNLVLSSTVHNAGGGLVITANSVVAPDGTMTGDLVQENTGNSSHNSNYVAIAGATLGQKYMVSFFIKKTDNPRPISYYATGNAGFAFDPTGDGAFIGAGSGTVNERGFEKLPNDWFRVWVIFTVTTPGTITCGLALTDWAGVTSYQGDGISGNYFWGGDVRLVDRKVQHFVTSGIADGPALDDFKIPLASIPWFDGEGEFLINNVVRVPNIVADKIVFPTNIADPIQTLRYRII